MSSKFKKVSVTRFRLMVCFAIASVMSSPVVQADDTLAGHAYVIDGDTLDIDGQRVRLVGIDAPESDQTCNRGGQAWRCGAAAEAALAQRVDGQLVMCDSQGTDRYGRVLGVCHTAAASINAWLVNNGWAIAYRYYSMAYVSQEKVARSAQRGIWSSDFMPPWKWRQLH